MSNVFSEPIYVGDLPKDMKVSEFYNRMWTLTHADVSYPDSITYNALMMPLTGYIAAKELRAWCISADLNMVPELDEELTLLEALYEKDKTFDYSNKRAIKRIEELLTQPMVRPYHSRFNDEIKFIDDYGYCLSEDNQDDNMIAPIIDDFKKTSISGSVYVTDYKEYNKEQDDNNEQNNEDDYDCDGRRFLYYLGAPISDAEKKRINKEIEAGNEIPNSLEIQNESDFTIAINPQSFIDGGYYRLLPKEDGFDHNRDDNVFGTTELLCDWFSYVGRNQIEEIAKIANGTNNDILFFMNEEGTIDNKPTLKERALEYLVYHITTRLASSIFTASYESGVAASEVTIGIDGIEQPMLSIDELYYKINNSTKQELREAGAIVFFTYERHEANEIQKIIETAYVFDELHDKKIFYVITATSGEYSRGILKEVLNTFKQQGLEVLFIAGNKDEVKGFEDIPHAFEPLYINKVGRSNISWRYLKKISKNTIDKLEYVGSMKEATSLIYLTESNIGRIGTGLRQWTCYRFAREMLKYLSFDKISIPELDDATWDDYMFDISLYLMEEYADYLQIKETAKKLATIYFIYTPVRQELNQDWDVYNTPSSVLRVWDKQRGWVPNGAFYWYENEDEATKNDADNVSKSNKNKEIDTQQIERLPYGEEENEMLEALKKILNNDLLHQFENTYDEALSIVDSLRDLRNVAKQNGSVDLIDAVINGVPIEDLVEKAPIFSIIYSN